MAIEITTELLKAAALKMAELTGECSFVLVGAGSLAITAPASGELARSDDVDMWPRNNETTALDECIEHLGEGSAFHKEYGFYIERVGSWTLLTQPVGWESRATRVDFDGIEVLALGLLDLAYNKLEVNRSKDKEFLKNALNEGLIRLADLEMFIIENAPSVETRERLFKNLKRIEGL
jgi:predicted nucleotidyltransferase